MLVRIHFLIFFLFIDHAANAMDRKKEELCKLAQEEAKKVTSSVEASHIELYIAARDGKLADLFFFLTKSEFVKEINSLNDCPKETALHIAVKKGHTSAAALLIRYGASDKIYDIDNRPPSYYVPSGPKWRELRDLFNEHNAKK